MILHDFALSSASYRVRIALNLKQIQYEKRSYKLRAGEQRAEDYLALNHAGLVPTLEVEGRTLVQSLAIIEWLDSQFPEPRLIPEDYDLRAHVQAIALSIACDVHPLNNLRVLLYLEKQLSLDKYAIDAWYAHWIHTGFEAVESLLLRFPDGQYACGDAPTLADVCIVPQLFNARRFNVDLTAYPRMKEVGDRALALPAFASAAPEKPAS